MSRSYPKTLEWWERARKVTVDGSQTASKSWSRYIVGATPGCISHGKGAHVWDIDGHEFIDWQCGLGAATIGYAHPAVTRAVTAQLEKGAIFPLPSELEDRVSRQLCAALKWPETVKWFKTGSEACAAAVRAARRVTSRDLIVTTASSYHGWHDWTLVRCADHPGVPEVMTGLITTFPHNDVAALERILIEHRVAAVMLEPTLVDPSMLGFLQEARRLAHEYGALYIHDNMILGGRAALGGGDELLHVQPDLSVFGKAIGGGLPLACVVGSHDLMQMTDTCSGTFGGDCLALAACEATLELYRTEPLIDRLWTAGRAMLDGLQQAVEYYDGLPAVVKGYPFRPVLAWTHSDARYLQSLFVQEAADRGVLMHPAGFLPSAAATHEDVRESVMACQEALAVVATALKKHDWRERLRGEPYREAFTRPEVKVTT